MKAAMSACPRSGWPDPSVHGQYLLRPGALDLLGGEIAAPRLHLFHDSAGHCVASLVLSTRATPAGGVDALVAALHLAPHLSFKTVLGALAPVLGDVASLYYRRHKQGRLFARQFSAAALCRFLPRYRGAVSAGLEIEALPVRYRAQARQQVLEGRQAGQIAAVLAAAPRYRVLPLAQRIARLRGWMEHAQYQLIETAAGGLAGLVTWAWLDPATLAAPPAPLDALHPSQWNEGDELCLCDIVVAPGAEQTVAAFIAERWFPEQPVCWMYPREAEPAWISVDKSQPARLLQYIGKLA